MKTKIILLLLSAVFAGNAAFAESGYVRHVRDNADAGQAWAQKALGDVFYFGIDMQDAFADLEGEERAKKMAENHKEAFAWYLKAAEQGDAAAMHAVGRAYYFAEGVEENDPKAAEWYGKAAEAGDAESLYYLAKMHERGIGVEQDLDKAEDFYLRAIYEHGHGKSLYPLARLYIDIGRNEALLLLIVAMHFTGNTAAERDYDAIDFNLLGVSPAREKRIWEYDADKMHDEMGKKWEVDTRSALSDISSKIATFAAPPSESLSPKEVYDRVWRSVVYIETDDGQGSGVIVQPDVVATNCHVVRGAVRGAGQIRVHLAEERSGQEDEPHPASPFPLSDGRDYCLLHVPSLLGSGVPATIRPDDTLEVGETVYALGAPRGRKLSFSQGIISQLRGGYIQSDVDFTHGSSGGGLFDGAGNLIGHTTSGVRTRRGGDEEGLNFSIPADIVLEFGRDE